MATVTINGTSVKVKNGTSILRAAESIGVNIPTLCFLEEVNEVGFCRLCVVEVEGEQDLVASCNIPVQNKMRVYTDTKRVLESRKTSLQLLASKHRFDCWKCPKEGHCEFYNVLKEYDVDFDEFGPSVGRYDEMIHGLGITQDQTKCILCKRCVSVCADEVSTRVLKFRDDDGLNPVVSPTIGLTFDEAGCISCGQCIAVCPTGTLFDTDHIEKVEELLKDKKRYVVAQTTSEVKSAIIEEFGLDETTSCKKIDEMLNDAFYQLGFEHSLDVSFANDLTTLEVAAELEDRILNGIKAPLFSSVCPSAVSYIEMYQPNHVENISRVKGPHVAQGALLKTYYNEKHLEETKKEITVVTLVSCPARKVEIAREDLNVDGVKDVDAVLTIREFARLLTKKEIDFKSLEGIHSESYFEASSGASILFGVSGGVTTSLIRTLYSVLEKKELSDLDFKALLLKSHTKKGLIREFKIKMLNMDIKFAVVDGGVSMKEMFKILDKTKKDYHFIELMACASGCINGGAMPINFDEQLNKAIMERADLLYLEDSKYRPNRKAHLNKSIAEIYTNFLKEPSSKQSHKYLYRDFSVKDIRNE